MKEIKGYVTHTWHGVGNRCGTVLLSIGLKSVSTVVLLFIIWYKYITFIVWYQFLFASKSLTCKELKNRTCMFNVKLSTVSWESWWMWNLQCWLTFTAQGNHCDVKDPGKIKRHKSAEEHQNLLQKFVVIFKNTSKDNALPQVATEGPFICHYVSMTFHLDQVSFLLVSIFY